MHTQDKLLCKLCLRASENVIFKILLPETIINSDALCHLELF